jgi:DNA-binding transcriptional ArsR family regulator
MSRVATLEELERIIDEEIDAYAFKACDIAEHLDGVEGTQLGYHMVELQERGVIEMWSSASSKPKTYVRSDN